MSLEEHLKKIKSLVEDVEREARTGFVRGNQEDTSGFSEAYATLSEIIEHATKAREMVNPSTEDTKLGGKKRRTRKRHTRRVR